MCFGTSFTNLLTLVWSTNLVLYTLKEETFAEETFASGKIREIFGRNFREFRELANFGFFARIIFREFHALNYFC